MLKNTYREDRDRCKEKKNKNNKIGGSVKKITVNKIKMAADKTRFSELEKISPHLFLSRWGSVHKYILDTALAGEFLCLNSGWMLRFRTLTNYSPPFVEPQTI